MADKKISQLTALAASSVAPSTDVLAIVDSSATETKKITAKDVVDGALNAGTANGVLYLNGSKEATSGSALSFSSSTLTVNNTVSANNGTNIVNVDAPNQQVSSFISGVGYGTLNLNASPLVFQIGGVEGMRLTSTGLGIGTSSPGSKIHAKNDDSSTSIAGGVNITLTLENADTTANNFSAISFNNGSTVSAAVAGQFTRGGNNAGNLLFITRNTSNIAAERMRLTSTGELLVGGTTEIGAASGIVSIQKADASPTLNLFRNDTSISSGNTLGQIGIYGNDTTSNTPTLHALIEGIASGTHAAGDNPTAIAFSTTPDGTATVREAFRINAEGGFRSTPLAGGHTSLNEDGVDADFRVESSTNTHALFLDGGNSRVGVNNSSPAQALDVTGNIQTSGTIITPKGNATPVESNSGFAQRFVATDTLGVGEKTRFSFTGATRRAALIKIKAVLSYTASNTSSNHAAAEYTVRVFCNSTGGASDSSSAQLDYGYTYDIGHYTFTNNSSFSFDIDIANPTGDPGCVVTYVVELISIANSTSTSGSYSLDSITTV